MDPTILASRAPGVPRAVVVGVLVVALALSVVPDAAAATQTNRWTAGIGSGGANGSATLTADTSGTGWFALRVMKLKPATSYAVTLAKGSCTGTSAVRLSSIRTGRAGATTLVARLSTSQTSAVYASTAGGRRLYIRVSAGSSARCGLFSARIVPPYVDATISVQDPMAIAIDATGVWVASHADDTLSRIDPATNTVVQTVRLPVGTDGYPTAIATGAGSLWVAVEKWDFRPETYGPLPGCSVLRVDPTTGTLLATIPVGITPRGIAAGPGAIWVRQTQGILTRIDPVTDTVVATVNVHGLSDVAADATGVWATGDDGVVTHIDPATNEVVATIPTGDSVTSVALGAGSVWVGNMNQGDDTVTRIDPARNEVVARTVIDGWPLDLAVGGGSVWVRLFDQGIFDARTVMQVDATSNRILGRTAIPESVTRLVADDRAVWVLLAVREAVARITHGKGTLSQPAPIMIAPSVTPMPSPFP